MTLKEEIEKQQKLKAKIYVDGDWYVELGSNDVLLESFIKFLQENIYFWLNEQQQLERQLEEL